MHDRSQQIEMSGRRAVWIRITSRRSDYITELRVLERGRIDEPAIARCVVIDANNISICGAEIGASKISDLKRDLAHCRKLLRSQTGR